MFFSQAEAAGRNVQTILMTKTTLGSQSNDKRYKLQVRATEKTDIEKYETSLENGVLFYIPSIIFNL